MLCVLVAMEGFPSSYGYDMLRVMIVDIVLLFVCIVTVL